MRSSFVITEANLKILYISQYFPPEMGAPAARVSELSRHWAEQGHDVTVLTGFPNHPDGVLRPEYRTHFYRGVFREQWNEVNVVRTWLLPLPNRRAYERALNYSSFCTSAALTGSFLNRPDVVIATSPQLLVGLSGYWVSRLKNVRFVLEVRDLWPESLVGAGVANHESALYRGIARIARFLYRVADAIVVVSPAFREQLIQRWAVPARKIHVVENGVETALFSPHARGYNVRASLDAQNRFIVSYIGTLGFAHGLDVLVEAAARLQETAPEVLFMIVGEGADRERIVSVARSRNLSNIRFVPQQPREKIPEFIAASDLCTVMLKGSEVFETVIPTKMLEFMSCARPVILAARGQAQHTLESAGAGWCIEPGNSQELCDAIVRLQQNPPLRTQLGANGRSYIVRELSRKRTASEYVEVLDLLLRPVTSAQEAAA